MPVSAHSLIGLIGEPRSKTLRIKYLRTSARVLQVAVHSTSPQHVLEDTYVENRMIKNCKKSHTLV